MVRVTRFARAATGFGMAVIGLAAMSCGISSAWAEGRPLQEVRISRIPIASYVPMDLAMARGWFKDEGLDVTVGAVAPGAVSMQGLLSNKLDIIYTSLDAAMKARAQGFDPVIISNNNNAQTKTPDAGGLLVRVDSGFKSLKDLEGKQVLVNVLQNVNWAYTREAIAKAGGDPNKVRFLEVPFQQQVDAMLGGRADAASETEPFTSIGVSTGKLSILSYMFVEVQPGLNIAGWVARESWVKEHPVAVAALRRVLQKAIDFLDSNEEEKTKAILQFTSLQPDLLKKMTLDTWSTKLDVADLQKQVVIYQRHGMIDKVFDVKTMIAP